MVLKMFQLVNIAIQLYACTSSLTHCSGPRSDLQCLSKTVRAISLRHLIWNCLSGQYVELLDILCLRTVRDLKLGKVLEHLNINGGSTCFILKLFVRSVCDAQLARLAQLFVGSVWFLSWNWPCEHSVGYLTWNCPRGQFVQLLYSNCSCEQYVGCLTCTVLANSM